MKASECGKERKVGVEQTPDGRAGGSFAEYIGFGDPGNTGFPGQNLRERAQACLPENVYISRECPVEWVNF